MGNETGLSAVPPDGDEFVKTPTPVDKEEEERSRARREEQLAKMKEIDDFLNENSSKSRERKRIDEEPGDEESFRSRSSIVDDSSSRHQRKVDVEIDIDEDMNIDILKSSRERFPSLLGMKKEDELKKTINPMERTKPSKNINKNDVDFETEFRQFMEDCDVNLEDPGSSDGKNEKEDSKTPEAKNDSEIDEKSQNEPESETPEVLQEENPPIEKPDRIQKMKELLRKAEVKKEKSKEPRVVSGALEDVLKNRQSISEKKKLSTSQESEKVVPRRPSFLLSRLQKFQKSRKSVESTSTKKSIQVNQVNLQENRGQEQSSFVLRNNDSNSSVEISCLIDPTYSFTSGTEMSLDPSIGVVVVELGHLYTKFGIGGNLYPSDCIHSIMTKHRVNKEKSYGVVKRNVFEYDSFHIFPGGIPMTGKISGWNELDSYITNTVLKRLGHEVLEQNALLMPVPPNMRDRHKSKLIDNFFQTYNSPGIYIPTTSSCTLIESGRVTGLVLESGFQTTHAAAIYNGHTIYHGVETLNFGGGDVTDHLARLIRARERFAFQRSDDILTIFERAHLREFKHSHCYIARNFSREDQRALIKPHEIRKEYRLPDGDTVVPLTSELFRAPELMFCPIKQNFENLPGIHEIVHNCLTKSCSGDPDFEKALAGNIVLGGGSVLFKGLDIRLKDEVEKLLKKKDVQIDVSMSHNQYANYSSWMGASKLSRMKSLFCSLAISRKEYEEIGDTIVHRKCL